MALLKQSKRVSLLYNLKSIFNRQIKQHVYTPNTKTMVQTRKTNSLRPRAPAKAAAAPIKAEKPKPAARAKPKKKIGDYTTFKLPNKKTAIGEIVAIEKNGAYVVELITEDKLMGKKATKAKKVGDFTVMKVGKKEAIGEIVGVKKNGGFIVEMITAESLAAKKAKK